jgi:hypothetical protein
MGVCSEATDDPRKKVIRKVMIFGCLPVYHNAPSAPSALRPRAPCHPALAGLCAAPRRGRPSQPRATSLWPVSDRASHAPPRSGRSLRSTPEGPTEPARATPLRPVSDRATPRHPAPAGLCAAPRRGRPSPPRATPLWPVSDRASHAPRRSGRSPTEPPRTAPLWPVSDRASSTIPPRSEPHPNAPEVLPANTLLTRSASTTGPAPALSASDCRAGSWLSSAKTRACR